MGGGALLYQAIIAVLPEQIVVMVVEHKHADVVSAVTVLSTVTVVDVDEDSVDYENLVLLLLTYSLKILHHFL